MRVVTITDNHLGGGLETRIQVCLRRAAAHLILAERTAPGSPADPAEIASFRPIGLALKAKVLAERIIAADADIVDLHPFHALVTGLLAACLAGRPAMLTLHGPTSLRPPAAEWQRAVFERLMSEARPCLIVVSEEVRAAAEALFPAARIALVANGVLPSGRALPDNGRRIAMATRLDVDKQAGIWEVLRLMRRAPWVRLDLFGDGSARSDVEREIRRLGLSARVRVWGHVDQPAAVFPRRAVVAGCGRALLEGLVQGRRGLVVSGTRLVGPVRRDGWRHLAKSNFSGRGVAATQQAEVLAWLRARPSSRDRVVDLVPTDMAARYARLAMAEIGAADPEHLRQAGAAALAVLPG